MPQVDPCARTQTKTDPTKLLCGPWSIEFYMLILFLTCITF